MEKDWVKIYSTGQEYLAGILKDMLMEHNIEAVVMNKQDSSYLSFGDIELYVKSENAIKAKYLIDKTDKN